MPFATAGELLAAKDRAPLTVSSGAAAVDALQIMDEEDIGFLPVVDGGKLVGVVSERDIARGVVLRQRVFVRDIMATHVHTVALSAKVPDCLAIMQRERIRHLPVVSGGIVSDGALHGVLSMRDLTGTLIERHERLLRKLGEERVMLLFPSGAY